MASGAGVKKGFPAERGRSGEVLSVAAERLRQLFFPGIRCDEAFDAAEALESLRGRTQRFKGTVVALNWEVRALPDQLEGVSYFNARREMFVVALGERTYCDVHDGMPRARFTVCHELGHIYLHSSELVTMRALPPADRFMARETANHPIYLDTEWQANSFSGRVLVPDAGLSWLLARGRFNAHEVANRFGVSSQVALARIDQFNREKGAALYA